MRIGIDLGGTKIEGIAIADDGGERLRRRVAAPRGDYCADARRRGEPGARHRARDRRPRGTVGVGIPGTISPATGLIKNANSTWLIGRPLGEDLPAAARSSGPLRERRELFRAVGSDRRRGGRRGRRLRRHHRHRRRRRHRRQRSSARRRERDCGRVGTQPAAGAARRRASGARVLLRSHAAASKRFCRGRAWRATTPSSGGSTLTAAGDRATRGGGGRARRSIARAVRGAHGARARERHQRARS